VFHFWYTPAMDQKHLGGDFDEFLRDERLLHDAEATATKRVIACQIAREMEVGHLSKSEMADRMHTSRAALERLLDPTNPSVTLATLGRAAAAVGKKLKVELTET
jgi:antitoxin HicB